MSIANRYFLSYLHPIAGLTEKYSGPPPSNSGYYVLAQIRPRTHSRGQVEEHFDWRPRICFSRLPRSGTRWS